VTEHIRVVPTTEAHIEGLQRCVDVVARERRWLGFVEGPPIVQTRIDAPLKSRGDRRNYMRVRVVARDGELVSLPMTSQGSGVSTSMVQANGLVIVETGVTKVEAGSMVPTVLVGAI